MAAQKPEDGRFCAPFEHIRGNPKVIVEPEMRVGGHAVFACANKLLGGVKRRIPTRMHVHHGANTIFLKGLDHAHHVVPRRSQWLFNNHILLCFGAGNRNVGVQKVRRNNGNRVAVARLEHLTVIRIDLRDAKLGGKSLCAFFVQIAHCNRIGKRMLLVDARMRLAPEPSPNNRHFYPVHRVTSIYSHNL